MKKKDIPFIFLVFIIIFPFMPLNFLQKFQSTFLFHKSYWLYTSFAKFAILATLGEIIGLRLKTGNYTQKEFGVIPRAIVWGFLGVGIKCAFVIFATGTPIFLEKYAGLSNAIASINTNIPDIFVAFEKNMGWVRIITAFSISTVMNIIFAPVFMTLHKITDTHIIENGGTIKGFLRPIQFAEIFPKLNWSVQWNFVFKKTIPLFWIPAHTITFLMAPQYRVAFAALLGVVLGIILAIASMKEK